MPSITRHLHDDVLYFDLDEECDRVADSAIVDRNGRNASTLVKFDALRATLIVIGAGGGIPEHHSDGPITVLGVRGTIQFTVGEKAFELTPGKMLSCGPGVLHSVASEEGGAFLLTVSA